MDSTPTDQIIRSLIKDAFTLQDGLLKKGYYAPEIPMDMKIRRMAFWLYQSLHTRDTYGLWVPDESITPQRAST